MSSQRNLSDFGSHTTTSAEESLNLKRLRRLEGEPGQNECQRCRGHIPFEYRKIFGSNDHVVYCCPDCPGLKGETGYQDIAQSAHSEKTARALCDEIGVEY